MKKKLEEFIADYMENAVTHGEATNEGDYKVANASHDKLMTALSEIRKFGNEGDIALLALSDDENDSVKCWAATHSLKYNKDKAEKVLLDLSKKSGPIAFNAEMVLSEWKKGTLEIP
jgi:predicted transcriptional regulator